MLARAGKAGPVVLFARNRLCALARPEVGVTSDTLLDRLLDPAVTLGTSTPRADPAGDYAWEVFRRAEALRPGSQARLEAKARPLVGGPTSAPPPADRSVYAQLLADRQADLFLTYCTNATQASREAPSLQLVSLPATPRGRRGLRPHGSDRGKRGSRRAPSCPVHSVTGGPGDLGAGTVSPRPPRPGAERQGRPGFPDAHRTRPIWNGRRHAHDAPPIGSRRARAPGCRRAPGGPDTRPASRTLILSRPRRARRIPGSWTSWCRCSRRPPATPSRRFRSERARPWPLRRAGRPTSPSRMRRPSKGSTSRRARWRTGAWSCTTTSS